MDRTNSSILGYLCDGAGVSISGYYNDHSKQSDSGKQKDGAQQMKMHLKRPYNINMNLKAIRRIMRKYNLECKIRKQDPYKQMIKADPRHKEHEDHLERNFNPHALDKGSNNLKIDFVLDTIKELGHINLPEGALIHSDQGGHYASPKFTKAVQSLNPIQSMACKGNCWDNAPIASFYGHMKDYID